MLAELVKKNRSYRRFDESAPVSLSDLEEMVDLARLTASGGNLQPLKYKLVCDAERNAKVFDCLRWAGYLQDWDGPAPGERPTGYIVILRDNEITNNFIVDHGIAVQTMKLRAVEMGLGGCIMGSIDRKALRELLDLSTRYEILMVLALGKPAEEVVVDEAEADDIRYWRDSSQTHHVPKRPLKEVLL